MQSTTSLVLGGGMGGLATARTLRGLLPAEHRITVVDAAADFSVGATNIWLATGRARREELARPREALLPAGVDLVEAAVTRVDPASGEVETSAGRLRGDYVVIALGADVSMKALPGLDSAETFYTQDGAERLAARLRDFAGGDLVLLIPRLPFKCPAAPYEAAFVIERLLGERGLAERSRISIHTVEETPLGAAGPEAGKRLREALAARGIEFHPGRKVSTIDPGQRGVLFEDGTQARFDLLIAVPVHEAPRAARDSGLTSETGWIPVDPGTFRVASRQGPVPVYAVGDVTVLPLPGRFRPDRPLALPKAGVFAEAQGKAVARDIAARALGGGSPERFDGKGYCFLETGGGEAMKVEGSFLDLPHPEGRLCEADAATHQLKRDWVDRWLTGRI
ncbi:MAG TPA: FAD/NAD(P)-binding oxidoreductase [Candidatus Polarisedimenticolia bacterium]|nr:FAD/NAD(P)-binding oxidoreductase [Candidatus Polarisedimenticolia bacterium]